MPRIGGTLAVNVVVLAAFALFAASSTVLFVGLVLVGGGVAVGPALHTRFIDVAGDAQTLAAALMHSGFDIANALGAWRGGAAVAGGHS